MRQTMAPAVKSVLFIDSETISKQIFASARYNLPLFLCKKLNHPSKAEDRNAGLQQAKNQARGALLRRMAKYHVNELDKDTSRRTEKSSAISQPDRPSTGRSPRCNAHRLRWPHCPKPLRDWRKEWSLPPGRYRLGGSIADCANLSTGPVAIRPNRTTAAGSRRTGPSGGTRDTEGGHELHLPSAMNKLLHPRKYFVGKIRPGDRMNERPALRLAITEPTVCVRDPNEPGPTSYDPDRQSSVRAAAAGSKQRPVCCYTYDSYCREPFFRPAPGRYEPSRQTSVLPSPGPTARRYRGTTPQIRIPIPPSVTVGGKPAGHATLRLNSINIPVRPRKGRRSMKVAFTSGSPRFRDRDFFPIGGLGSRTTSTRPDGPGAGRVRGTSKKFVVGSYHTTASGSAGVAGEGGERGRGLEEKDEGDVAEFLLAHGITKGIRQLPAGPLHRIPTRFFIVPTLSQRDAV